MSSSVDVLAVMRAVAEFGVSAPEWHDMPKAVVAVAELIDVAKRAIPFLRDEGAKYEDDGSNEPLEAVRDLEALIERIGGAE